MVAAAPHWEPFTSILSAWELSSARIAVLPGASAVIAAVGAAKLQLTAAEADEPEARDAASDTNASPASLTVPRML
jgi:hypothetical protein